MAKIGVKSIFQNYQSAVVRVISLNNDKVVGEGTGFIIGDDYELEAKNFTFQELKKIKNNDLILSKTLIIRILFILIISMHCCLLCHLFTFFNSFK